MTTAPMSDGAGLQLRSGPDVFERVLGSTSRRERRILGGAVGLALILHVGLGGAAASAPYEIRSFVEMIRERAAARTQQIYQIDTEEAPPPEPEPEPEPQPEPEPEPVVIPPSELPTEAPTEAAAPAAAEAAAVLTAAPEPDAPLDLTDQGFISGTGTRFAGGITAATGTATTAVRSTAASATGTPGGTGTAPTGPAVASRARAAGLMSGSNWSDCPFPPEADAEQIHQAVVRLVVVVGRDGRPKSVTVLDDPGYGFGRQAKRYAMGKTYEPALDALGNPIEASTPPFKVRFQR